MNGRHWRRGIVLATAVLQLAACGGSYSGATYRRTLRVVAAKYPSTRAASPLYRSYRTNREGSENQPGVNLFVNFDGVAGGKLTGKCKEILWAKLWVWPCTWFVRGNQLYTVRPGRGTKFAPDKYGRAEVYLIVHGGKRLRLLKKGSLQEDGTIEWKFADSDSAFTPVFYARTEEQLTGLPGRATTGTSGATGGAGGADPAAFCRQRGLLYVGGRCVCPTGTTWNTAANRCQ